MIEGTVLVAVRRLPLLADIGIHPHEIGRLQSLVVDVEVLTVAPTHDAIDATIDYRALARIAEEVATERTALIETFALRIGERSLALAGSVQRVTVRVDKPDALVSGMAATEVTVLQEHLEREDD